MLNLIENYYIPVISDINSTQANNLMITVFYDSGSYSYFTHEENKRGYYVCVKPVIASNDYKTLEEALFQGYKYLLKEVKRQSKKAESEALELANDIDWLIRRVCNEFGFKLIKDNGIMEE